MSKGLGMFATKYRIARDSCFSFRWAVQAKRWWWPFWVEVGAGLLETKEDALDLINELRTIR